MLAGPKTPEWACICGETRNFACRIVCRCGRNAPRHIRRQAELEARKAAKGKGKGGGGSGNDNASSSANSEAARAALAKRVNDLEQQVQPAKE